MRSASLTGILLGRMPRIRRCDPSIASSVSCRSGALKQDAVKAEAGGQPAEDLFSSAMGDRSRFSTR
jgi:hypothetical protein